MDAPVGGGAVVVVGGFTVCVAGGGIDGTVERAIALL